MADTEDRTYTTRTMTMHDGTVFQVRMDDWYWYHYDGFVSPVGKTDATTLQTFLYGQALQYAQQEAIEPVDAFSHTLAFWIQESINLHSLFDVA